MDRVEEIRFNELSEIARSRMDLAPYSKGAVFAEIHYMTADELSEFMDLRAKLPSFGQIAKDAKDRLSKKILSRKSAIAA